MRFRSEHSALNEALTTAARAVRNQSRPDLTGLRLDLEGDRLRIRGTDETLAISTEVEVTGERDGTALIRAKLLTEIVAALDAGAVTLDVGNDTASLTSGRSSFDLHLLHHDPAPVPAPVSDYTMTLEAGSLAAALKQVLRAASTDENKPTLAGVLFTAVDDGLRLVTTDSYRLAIADVPGASPVAGDRSIIVPKRALDELVRVLGGVDKVEVVLGDRDVDFLLGSTRISTRLVVGDFPKYETLIPSGYPNTLRINRDEFQAALRRVALLVRNTPSTPVRVTMGPDGVNLTAEGFEEGKAEELVDGGYTGSELVIGFNPAYLRDGIDAIQGEADTEIVIETDTPNKVACIHAGEPDGFLYLVMPHRL